MQNSLKCVLNCIATAFKGAMMIGSDVYREVNIGREAVKLGYPDLGRRYHDVFAIVPLKQTSDGMKVRIDGRTFVNYAQFESGLVVPGYVAKTAGIPFKAFVANDSMVLDCV